MKRLLCKIFGCKFEEREHTVNTEEKYPYDVVYYKSRRCKRCNRKQFFDRVIRKYIGIEKFNKTTQKELKKLK